MYKVLSSTLYNLALRYDHAHIYARAYCNTYPNIILTVNVCGVPVVVFAIMIVTATFETANEMGKRLYNLVPILCFHNLW
jgi:hypothetical protein